MKRIRKWISYTVPPAVGLGFYVGTLLAGRMELQKLAILACTVILMTSFVLLATYLAARDAGSVWRRLRLALTPTLFTATAFGYYLLLESRMGRYGLIALVIAVLAVWFIQLRKALHPLIPVTLIEFAHLSYAMHVVAMFFVYAFAFGVNMYVYVPSPLLALGVGLIGTIVAFETLGGVRAARGEKAAIIAVIGVLAAEFQGAVIFLPTSHIVDAAVALILFVLALHVFRQVLCGVAEAKTIRRHFALSTLLVVLVLFTAQWT